MKISQESTLKDFFAKHFSEFKSYDATFECNDCGDSCEMKVNDCDVNTTYPTSCPFNDDSNWCLKTINETPIHKIIK